MTEQINPSGLCMCECGETVKKARINTRTKLGTVHKGEYLLYKRYHHSFGRSKK